MKRLATILILALAAVAWGQTNDPTDTPTVRALTALLRLEALVHKAKFVAFLASPEGLIATRALYDRPNYGGNAFEAKRRTLWLRVVKGENSYEH